MSAPAIMALRDTRPWPSRKALAVIENDRRQLADYVASLGNAAPATVHDKLAEDYVKLRKLGIAGASGAAIEQYETILRDAPGYEDTDAVLYYLGLEYETGGNQREAARRYHELMRRSPQSVYVPLAQFSLGELELDRAGEAPSAYRAALAAYLSVVEYSDAKIAAAARERIVEV